MWYTATKGAMGATQFCTFFFFVVHFFFFGVN